MAVDQFERFLRADEPRTIALCIYGSSTVTSLLLYRGWWSSKSTPRPLGSPSKSASAFWSLTRDASRAARSNFAGHTFEGNSPAFLTDKRTRIVGALWWAQKVGLPLRESAARLTIVDAARIAHVVQHARRFRSDDHRGCAAPSVLGASFGMTLTLFMTRLDSAAFFRVNIHGMSILSFQLLCESCCRLSRSTPKKF